MSWELRIHDALGVYQRSVTNLTEPVSIEGAVSCKVAPGGGCLEMTFAGRNDLLLLGPRRVVQYLEDAVPLFWGPVTVCPPLDSPGAGPGDAEGEDLGRFVVEGGRKLLEGSVVGPKLFDEPKDVSSIALTWCQLYAHPALTILPTNFPASGGLLNVAYAPEKSLDVALTELAETVPGRGWWVDAVGAVHFRAVA